MKRPPRGGRLDRVGGVYGRARRRAPGSRQHSRDGIIAPTNPAVRVRIMISTPEVGIADATVPRAGGECQGVPVTGAEPRQAAALAVRLLLLTIGWNLVGGLGVLVAGWMSRNLAFGGFGAHTLIDTAASSVLVWHFRQTDREATTETSTGRAIAAALLLVGLALGVQAGRLLAEGARPEFSGIGAALLVGSLAVLPPLAIGKLRLARALESPGLRGDGILTAASSILALVTLAGGALDRVAGWWWADDGAALAIAAFLLWQGVDTVRRSGREVVKSSLE